MKAVDIFDKEIKVGDYIAAGSSSKSREIYPCIVSEITKKGYIRICAAYHGGSMIQNTRHFVVVLEESSVPERCKIEIRTHIEFRINAILKYAAMVKMTKDRQEELDAYVNLKSIWKNTKND